MLSKILQALFGSKQNSNNSPISITDEEDVMQISKKWSIDTSFESKTFPASTGYSGKLM